MKIAAIYHSESGNTLKAAELILSGAQKLEGVETKSMSIEDIDEAFIAEATVVFFGTPTYMGTYSWQMKKWLDTYKLSLAGKIGCVFATANFYGGGAENAELAIASELLAKGMFVHSGGCASGQPFTHFGAVSIKDGSEDEQLRYRAFGERVARNVMTLCGGAE